MKISSQTIQEVKDRINAVDVVGDYVNLKKAGKEHRGLCPFHSEKTPSFFVNEEKNTYHCHGCKAGGDAIKFIQEINKSSFIDAVLALADKYNIQVQTLHSRDQQEYDQRKALEQKLRAVMTTAATFYQKNLTSKCGQNALQYLKQRQITTDSLFGLGFASSDRQSLFCYLKEQGYLADQIERAGLVQRSHDGTYLDSFRDRLIIPIRDKRGQTIAFGSRSLDGREPKYLNSRETILFNKSSTLYAIDLALEAIKANDSVIVVEGYLDAISLHQAGIKNVVASLGTAFSEDHLKQLYKLIPDGHIIFHFDNDTAGLAATGKAIKLAQSTRLEDSIRILKLDSHKDPDEFIRTERESACAFYSEALANSEAIYDWLFEMLTDGVNLADAGQFAAVAKTFIPFLGDISSPELQGFYISKCAEYLSQGDVNRLRAYTERFYLRLNKPITTTAQIVPTHDETQSQWDLLILIYLRIGNRLEFLDNLIRDMYPSFSKTGKLLWETIQKLEDDIYTVEFPGEDYLINGLITEYQDRLDSPSLQFLFLDDSDADLECNAKKLYGLYLKDTINEITKSIGTINLDTESGRLAQLQDDIKSKKNILKALDNHD